VVSWSDVNELKRMFKASNKNACGKMFCTTCGGQFRSIIDNLDPNSIRAIKDVLKRISLSELDKYLAEWIPVLDYFDSDGYIDIFIREANQLDLTDINAVDRFLIRTKDIDKNYNAEFSVLYRKILKYAVSKSVSESHESLAETVIVVLGNKAKEYHGLIEYALSVSRHNSQMKRVLYNFFREEIEEVRDFNGDGNTSLGWY